MLNPINPLIRFKIIVFTIFSLVGLYFAWDPTYLIYTLIAFFLYENIGHDIGLHRYYTHRSFTCNKFVESFLWLCAFFSAMSDPINWARQHRRHHMHSDTKYDNFQPLHHPILTWFGFGTLKAERIDFATVNLSDLTSSKFHRVMRNWYYPLYFTMVAVTLLIDFKLALYVLILPATLTAHCGSATNVICHKWGYKNFNLNDASTNCTWVNWIMLGTGLHNNHHMYPFSYTHKVKDSEIDVQAWIIKRIATSVIE